MRSFIMISVKVKQSCTISILPKLATFSYQSIVILTFGLLNRKFLGRILDSSAVMTILPDQASTNGQTDGQTERQSDSSIPPPLPTSLRGYNEQEFSLVLLVFDFPRVDTVSC